MPPLFLAKETSKAVAVDPQNALVHYALGFACLGKGKSGYRNSLTQLNQALALGGLELSGVIKSSIEPLLAKIKKTIK